MLLSIKTSTGKTITVEAPKSVKTEVRYKQGVVFAVSYDKDTGNQIIEMEDSIQDIKIQEAQQAPLRESEEVTGDPIKVEASENIRNEEKPDLAGPPAEPVIRGTAASGRIVNVRLAGKRIVQPNRGFTSYLPSSAVRRVASPYQIRRVSVDGNFNVFVKNSTGGKTTAVSIKNTDTIGTLKLKVQEKEGIPPNQQRLIFKGLELMDYRTVAHCGLRHGTSLDLVRLDA